MIILFISENKVLKQVSDVLRKYIASGKFKIIDNENEIKRVANIKLIITTRENYLFKEKDIYAPILYLVKGVRKPNIRECDDYILIDEENILILPIIMSRITNVKIDKYPSGLFTNQLRKLANTLPLGIYITSPGDKILYINNELTALLGYDSPEELMRRGLSSNLFEPNYARTLFKNIIKKEGRIKGLESVWTLNNGKKLNIRENVVVINDSNGKLLYFIGSVEDITITVQSKDILKITEEHIKAIIDSAEDEVIVLNRDGLILDLNKFLADKFKMTKKEMVGKNIWDLMPKDILDERKKMIESVFITGNPLIVENKKCIPHSYKHKFYPIFSTDNKIVSIVMFSRNSDSANNKE